MRSHINRALARADRETDRLLAYLRLLVFLVITAVFWNSGALSQDHMAMFSTTGLGMLALISLLLVWSGFFRPWLPWTLATLDIGLLLHCLGLLAMTMGLSFYGTLGAPGASLIFLFLATAAVRHRPFLVLYTGALFVGGWTVLWVAAGKLEMAAMPAPGESFAGEAARLAVIVLTTAYPVRRGRADPTRADGLHQGGPPSHEPRPLLQPRHCRGARALRAGGNIFQTAESRRHVRGHPRLHGNGGSYGRGGACGLPQ